MDRTHVPLAIRLQPSPINKPQDGRRFTLRLTTDLRWLRNGLSRQTSSQSESGGHKQHWAGPSRGIMKWARLMSQHRRRIRALGWQPRPPTQFAPVAMTKPSFSGASGTCHTSSTCKHLLYSCARLLLQQHVSMWSVHLTTCVRSPACVLTSACPPLTKKKRIFHVAFIL